MPLSLSRREDQSVILTLPDGREIVVQVREIEGKRVRLAFDAPPDVRIMRDELLTREPREK